jgi:hypothetical protein
MKIVGAEPVTVVVLVTVVVESSSVVSVTGGPVLTVVVVVTKLNAGVSPPRFAVHCGACLL